MADHLDLDALRPTDTPAFMQGAWLGCIRFALTKPGILEAFRRDTGNRWTPARSGLDQMIDEATGADLQFFEAFMRLHFRFLSLLSRDDGADILSQCYNVKKLTVP